VARKTDAVTRWWRGLSLRAKVTGVTVALLTFGLIAAGLGTMAFLRNTLIQNLNAQLESLVVTPVAETLLEFDDAGGEVVATVKQDAAPTDYVVALYGPDGEFIIQAGGDGEHTPDLPETQTLERTASQGVTPFFVPSVEGGSGFHASVDTYQIPGRSELFTQMLALPLAPINEVVATFLSIYGILAFITIVAGALLTRWLVTLTFRSLGQVESTAEAIAAGDFSQRMTDIEPTTTEVGRLKTAINTMLGRVDAAISQRDATVQQMRRFVGDASHELRTPLVTVRGYAELYRMGAIADDEAVAQAMERIEGEAKRMGLLVEDLLALARLDERRDVIITPVDLRPIARDAALDLRVTAPRRTVTVIDTTVAEREPPTDADEEEKRDAATRRSHAPTSAIARAGATLSLLRRRPKPIPAVRPAESRPAPAIPPRPATPSTTGGPVVLGDENRIRQVVANLLGNAKRFTADDSPLELEVGIDPDARTGWIAVVDHGEGVPDQIKEKIFQRFWRADTSRARETGGTGLGLSIVASIVDALGGSVRVTDTPGGGATFRVAFPLADERSEHLVLETQPLTSPGSGAR
jgi:two-component system OmpR family sensor kinase